MADPNQTKAERRQASAHASKAERKQAKLRRRQQSEGSPASETAERTSPADAGSGDGIERRLARLEEAVATQSELSEQLLAKLDEVLHEARKSSRHAKAAVTQAGEEGGGEPQGI